VCIMVRSWALRSLSFPVSALDHTVKKCDYGFSELHSMAFECEGSVFYGPMGLMKRFRY
jgi:hypothetical protein